MTEAASEPDVQLFRKVARDLESLAFWSDGMRAPLAKIANGSGHKSDLDEINAGLKETEAEVAGAVDRLAEARERLPSTDLGIGIARDLDDVISAKVGPGAIRDKLSKFATAQKVSRARAQAMLNEIEQFNQRLDSVHEIVRPKHKDGKDLSTNSSPLSILTSAIRAVPSVRYALGVAGVAAAGAIISTLAGGYSRTTLILVALVFVGMMLLFIFSGLVVAQSQSSRLAGQVLMWSVTLFFICFLVFTTTAAAAGWPCNWANFLSFKSACDIDRSAPANPMNDLLNKLREKKK